MIGHQPCRKRMPLRRPLAEPPAQLDRTHRGAVHQHDCELILSPAAHEVFGTQDVSPPRRRLGEKCLFCDMPLCAVAVGPVIECNQREAQGMLAAPRMGNVTCRLSEERTAVWQRCEAVANRGDGRRRHVLVILDPEDREIRLGQLVGERFHHSHRRFGVVRLAWGARMADKVMDRVWSGDIAGHPALVSRPCSGCLTAREP